MFLGTAHHVPEKFRILRVVAKLFRPYLPRMPHVLKDPKHIETQNAQFLEMQTQAETKIYSFYENPGVGGIMGHRVVRFCMMPRGI